MNESKILVSNRFLTGLKLTHAVNFVKNTTRFDMLVNLLYMPGYFFFFFLQNFRHFSQLRKSAERQSRNHSKFILPKFILSLK